MLRSPKYILIEQHEVGAQSKDAESYERV